MASEPGPVQRAAGPEERGGPVSHPHCTVGGKGRRVIHSRFQKRLRGQERPQVREEKGVASRGAMEGVFEGGWTPGHPKA